MISSLLFLSFILSFTRGKPSPSSNLRLYSPVSLVSDSNLELSVQHCNKYTCKLPGQEFVNSTCGYLDQAGLTVYSQPCTEPSSYCKLDQETLNFTCKPYNPIPISYPGDKCSATQECYAGFSQSCTNGICIGLKIGQPCQSSGECDPNSSCREINGNLQCAPLLKIGQKGCYKEFDCVYNAGCNVTSATDMSQNTCMPYGSFPPGSKISIETCSWSQNLCSSHLCTQKEAGDDIAVCTGNIESNGTIPISCEVISTISQCESKVDNYTGVTPGTTCLCGYNSNGISYCGLQSSDTPMKAYYRELKKWQESSGIKKCNTYWRYPIYNGANLQCIKNNYDKDSYESLFYWYLYTTLYPQIYGAEECVLNTFFPLYLLVKDSYNGGSGGDTDDSGAGGIVFASIFLIFNH